MVVLGGDVRLVENRVQVRVVDAVDHVQLATRILDAAQHDDEQLERELPRLRPHADGVVNGELDELGELTVPFCPCLTAARFHDGVYVLIRSGDQRQLESRALAEPRY